MRALVLGVTLAALTSGCSFYARSADDYRKVTRETLATRKPEVQSCYSDLAENDETVAGKVVVQFDVEAKTGKIVNTKVAEESSTAPEPLQACVLASLDGLAIDPPDQRTGKATFTYEFEVK